MNGITIILWITIAIFAVSAIILVKLHYKGKELEKEEGITLNDVKPMSKLINAGQNILSRNNDNSKSTHSNQLNYDDFENAISFNEVYEEPVAYEVENDKVYNNIEYESENQVLIDYGNTVEKFQEPIKESQMDIMSQNNNPNNEKRELKDLFTIDELIKESKRKDSEREKESFSVDDSEEINELKESIKQRQENNVEDSLIEEIVANKEETITQLINETDDETESEIAEESEVEKSEETINDLIGSKADDEKTIEQESETPIVTSQDIEEAINTASQETEEENESISESGEITDILLDNAEDEAPKEEIKEPILKTPTKVDESKDEFGADIKDSNMFGEYDNDLDYRKDLAKITNTIKGSKIFQDVKERLTVTEPEPQYDNLQEDFIRNVNEYDDEFAPIINETHSDFDATYEEYHESDFDERLRHENSKKVFNIVETPKKPVESKIGSIKEKPSRDNIKIQINNNEVVLKKGDEIIFNHLGETYSSQVYAINGDDISVKYRRQDITIKPSDVKKVY